MTIPSSGPISFSTIKNEFGGTSNNLGSYYRGGTWVNTNTVAGPNGAIPTSGTNSFSKYRGVTKYVAPPPQPQANITGPKTFIIADGTPSGDSYSSSISFYSNGQVVLSSTEGTTIYDTWAEPLTSGFGNNWFIRFIPGSANASMGGTFNTWLQLSQTRVLTMVVNWSGDNAYSNPSAQIATSAGGGTYQIQVTHQISLTVG